MTQIEMDLNQAGISIICRCGAGITAGMADVLFGDRGRVQIGNRSLRCPVCGAIYRRGERLKYRLGIQPDNDFRNGYRNRSQENIEVLETKKRNSGVAGALFPVDLV